MVLSYNKVKNDIPEWDSIKDARPGDIIKFHRTFYDHYGILASKDFIIDLSPHNKNGVPFIGVSYIKDVVGNDNMSWEMAKNRLSSWLMAFKCVGREGYDLINYNCEHFARFCAGGKIKSTQVKDTLDTIDDMINIVTLGLPKIIDKIIIGLDDLLN